MIKKKDLDSIYAHVCPKCGGFHASADAEDFDIGGELDRIIREVYDGQIKSGDIDLRLANKVAATISQAVSEGYAQPFSQVAWESPDWQMIRNLERNVYQFSFAKCYEQMKATTMALRDDQGKVVPFSEFKEVASRINNEYNVNYLRTEYNTAIGSAQMASRWVQFQDDAEVLPYLRYDTVGDKNVRPEHARLNGVFLPIDDDFWDVWYPPNGWGCRCDVTQHDGGPVTDKSKITYPSDTPSMFRTNLAKNGLTFPKGHPYFTNLPDEVKQAANGQNPFMYNKVHESDNGGYVYDNPLHNHGEGWAEQLKTAKILANNGDKVILFPELNNDAPWQKELRKMVIPENVKEGKNPDGSVNGRTVDLKYSKTNTANSIDKLLRGKSQSDTVCIRLSGKMPEKDLKSAIKGRVMRSDIQEVWVIKAGSKKPVKYTRKAIEAFK